MELIKVSANVRNQSGKGVARRLRASGRIPAVVYGSDVDARSIDLSPKDIASILHSDHGRNSVVELTLEGGSTLNVLLADYQYHPVTRKVLHADFLHVSLDQELDVAVPFETVGKSKGVVLGGVLTKVYRDLPLRCKPADIPAKIQFDVTNLELDAHAHVSDLVLPAGVAVRLPQTQTIVSVLASKASAEDEVKEDGAEGAAATKAEAKSGA